VSNLSSLSKGKPVWKPRCALKNFQRMKLTNFVADPSMPIAFDTESLGFL
jgi:hypothetical protein